MSCYRFTVSYFISCGVLKWKDEAGESTSIWVKEASLRIPAPKSKRNWHGQREITREPILKACCVLTCMLLRY